MRNVLKGRKLLIASVGVAAVSYACHERPEMSGNLMAPLPTSDAAVAAPEPQPPTERYEPTGNLMPPEPPLALSDAGVAPKPLSPPKKVSKP